MTDVYWAQVRVQRDEAREQLATTEAERDGAYRERAQLVAWLAALHPAVLAPAPDVDEDGWQILYLTAGGQQLSWHIAPADADLFGHVQQVPSDDPRAQWDGHSTAEKYKRIQMLAAIEGPVQQSAVGRNAVAVMVRIREALAGSQVVPHIDTLRLLQLVLGTRRPTSLDLALIGEACGVSVDWLLGHG